MANIFESGHGKDRHVIEEETQLTGCGTLHSFMYIKETNEYLSITEMYNRGWIPQQDSIFISPDKGIEIVWKRMTIL